MYFYNYIINSTSIFDGGTVVQPNVIEPLVCALTLTPYVAYASSFELSALTDGANQTIVVAVKPTTGIVYSFVVVFQLALANVIVVEDGVYVILFQV